MTNDKRRITNDEVQQICRSSFRRSFLVHHAEKCISISEFSMYVAGVEARRHSSSAGSPRRFDLDDRLLDLAVAICRIVSSLRKDERGSHIASQLVRSGTAPAANYAEARDAESRRDFIHKLKLVLKELRESLFWLRLAKKLSLARVNELDQTIAECHELIAILVRSIATARKNL